MSSGHHGFPYGYPRPAYAGATGTRTPVSPVSASASVLSLPHGYAPSAPSTAPPSPPKQAAAQPYSAVPPVPRHRQAPPSPTRYRRQSNMPSTRDGYSERGVAVMASRPRHESPTRQQWAGPPSGYGSTMDRETERTQAYSVRDMQQWNDVPGFNTHALQGIDDLYGGRMMSPSPEPEERAYGQPPANYPPTNIQYPPIEPKVLVRPRHQHTDSQNSVAPLLPQHSPQRAPQRARVPDSPPSTHRRSRSIPIKEAAGYPNSPYGHNYQRDGYDPNPEYINPQQIHDDGEDGFEQQPMHQRSAYPGRAGALDGGNEKSAWLDDETRHRKRMKWLIIGIIAFVVVAAIVGGVVGGILGSKSGHNGSSATSGSSGHTGDSSSLYDINSSEVQALLNNKDLHRVFPGIDYTPLNAQYPACLTNPPDQNNITLDIAMLSQLTPAVRLYGTDCNQTEMVLTAIDRLGYNDTIKVWLGVWLGNNATTNTRQLNQMYDILDTYPATHFAGVIVGNEVLFREDLTEAQLGDQLQMVRSNLTAENINLPVATSDLGDDWTTALAANTDIVMANVHPFFAGVTPDKAPGWSWSFWQNHDVVLTGAASSTASYPKHIISEIGWPSEGGNDCGTENGCPNDTAGAVASIDNMNSFMDGWVCQSLANGTTYFWFEAFDEPWKVIFNTDTDKWESKWGLMDSNRNVKSGLKIPDCGGQTVEKP